MLPSGWVLVTRAMAQAKSRMTVVRTAAARFESMSWTPTLASTAVSPANRADRSAQYSQLTGLPPFGGPAQAGHGVRVVFRPGCPL
jgi:hypothetical protein